MRNNAEQKKINKKYPIGSVVDLEVSNPLLMGKAKRLAEVVKIYPCFVLCEALVGGYKECINE